MRKDHDIPNSAWQIRMLSASAAELVRRGQLKEAAITYERILETAPYHVQALDFLAMHAYENGDTNLSLKLLERSSYCCPNRAINYQNIGIVRKAQGDYELALEAINRALQLQPVYPLALLHKGSILERIGQKSAAIRAYVRALAQFSESSQIRNLEQITGPARTLIAHAHDVIFKIKDEMLDKALEHLREEYGSTTLSRAEAFVKIYLGKNSPAYNHSMQRPAFLYFPQLHPQAFFHREDFGWLDEIEYAATEIRTELLMLLQNPNQFSPYVDITDSDAGAWKELNNSNKWETYHFYKYGERIESNCNKCPVTATAIDKLPLIQTPGHSPEAFFSILAPHTHIPPHHGLTNYKVTVHLPLLLPMDCAIRIGNETRTWNENQCLIFDDSFEHEVWNNSSELRAVLIFEVWNPQLSTAEQQAVVAVIRVIREFEREYVSTSNV